MLIKVTELEFEWEYDVELRQNVASRVDGTDVWINPDRVTFVYTSVRNHPEYGLIKIGNERYSVTSADAQRIIDHINQTPPPAAPAPVAAPLHKTVEILSMTRDKTKNSGSPMWRCGTSEAFMVNVFKHDDPLKDTFNLFDHAGYAPEMVNLNYGDTITWTRDSITVEIEQNGAFWNVVRVLERPAGALPDEPEPDDDEAPDSAE